jgi:hypothetical protein
VAHGRNAQQTREGFVKPVMAALVMVACVALEGTSPRAKEMVALRVTPTVSMAPATIRVVVTVEPDNDNRRLELVADSGLFYTSSTVQLDGSKAARLQSFILKELPGGTYEVSASVVQKNGDTRKATGEYMVIE